ncbi:MAG: chemotaxis response regulator protein-glutamate methylesterase [Cyclobacteriaceae bacterium]
MKKIRLLIVDDSALMRQILQDILQGEDIEVMGTASDPFRAAEIIKHTIPDVILLDVEMPRMDGLTFLKRLMERHPLPVVVLSSLTAERAETALKAWELGAVEVLEKPRIGHRQQLLQQASTRLREIIRLASRSKVQRHGAEPRPVSRHGAKVTAPILSTTTDQLIALGASTGGTEALRVVLENLPVDVPGLVIVQHMPEQFTRAFAERLNRLSRIVVKEARTGDRVLPGQALIAPGNQHIRIQRNGAQYQVVLDSGPAVNRHRPSVDVLFESVARSAGKNAVGVLLTGMGRDGAQGLLAMHQAGARTIAQDEASSVVYGMPKAAVDLGAAQHILPLSKVSDFLQQKALNPTMY